MPTSKRKETTVGGLDDRLSGSRASMFWRELLGNAAHFPSANLFYEIVTEGTELITAPDAYVLVIAAIAQAWISSGWQRVGLSRPMISNLIGPIVYLTLETLIEGIAFFEQPNHLIYLAFGLGVGAIRWSLTLVTSARLRLCLLLAEGLSRGLILLLMYAALETHGTPERAATPFFRDDSHQYITLSLVALGLLLGLYAYFEERTQTILHDTAVRLRQLSEWSFGRDMTSRAVLDSEAMNLQATTLCIIFIDLRGFTNWSDTRIPRDVVNMLNAFYDIVDRSVGAAAELIKLKFTADEAMIVVSQPEDAIRLAVQLRADLNNFLTQYELGVGIGIHRGPTVQGLLGSARVRLFDVIGDTVNVAKRLCDQALAGEILVSNACYAAADKTTPIAPIRGRRTLRLKGKSDEFNAVVI